jgi:hypothetical protein
MCTMSAPASSSLREALITSIAMNGATRLRRDGFMLCIVDLSFRSAAFPP